ncbi:MAG TPA: hypothetical protein VFH45_06265, partial [Acidimicrobiales bacterium]|nr:hypothetical protein [Acidimicrobiales bacterium]
MISVVLCRIAADNVGDTVVSLKQRGTGLSVETARITDEAEFTWEKGPVYSIFESHDRIEP